MSELDGTELVDWRELPLNQRRGWWQQLWDNVIALSERYRISLRSGWWEDSFQVEALAAFAGWLRLYDVGAYTDPPGKLQLLWELERLRAAVRAGEYAFDPKRDRRAFDRHMSANQPMAQSSHGGRAKAVGGDESARQELTQELAILRHRVAELKDREHLLEAVIIEAKTSRTGALNQAEADLRDLRNALGQLRQREREISKAIH